ncbi:sulfatase [bacterium]|nr:sulfatase [Akkermansiaceae bacterium]MDB4437261.1 sulfatase [bacterium]
MRIARLLHSLFLCAPLFSADAKPNILVILTDDHRYDAMGFLDHPFLKTPNLDRLAAEGAYFKNAYVTTSLCSPSRASILTGLYAHNHRVVDNYNPVSESLTFFPQVLQKEGYQTAFIGKWHMGDSDKKQRGFDHWISFKGQGVYVPDPNLLKAKGRFVPQATNSGFNINGKKVPQKGYITDELTGFAEDWLAEKSDEKPFLLYVSHKGVHADFLPPNQHAFKYDDVEIPTPPTPLANPELFTDPPMWVRNQSNSRHGTEFAYYTGVDMKKYYRRYCEALLAVDDSVGRLLTKLEKSGELENTIVLYLGDNGFIFGEHGLIDKRCAYEESVRIPMLMRYPKAIKGGTVVGKIVANIDVAPTLLNASGATPLADIDGESFWPLATGETLPDWRDYLLYEYYWERNYPQTPTTHAVIGERYKYIRYHGVWDTDELYDTKADPHERQNLFNDPKHQERIAEMNKALFSLLEDSKGNNMPLPPDRGTKYLHRKTDGTKGALFPEHFYRKTGTTGK